MRHAYNASVEVNYRPREFPRGVCIRPEPLRFHAEGEGVLGCGREERLRLAKKSSRFGTGTVWPVGVCSVSGWAFSSSGIVSQG